MTAGSRRPTPAADEITRHSDNGCLPRPSDCITPDKRARLLGFRFPTGPASDRSLKRSDGLVIKVINCLVGVKHIPKRVQKSTRSTFCARTAWRSARSAGARDVKCASRDASAGRICPHERAAGNHGAFIDCSSPTAYLRSVRGGRAEAPAGMAGERSR